MQIKEIEISNFRGIKYQHIELLPKINVFVGINGAGKSTILDSISIMLSWLINRIQREHASGKKIPELSIKNGENHSSLEITVEEYNQLFTWSTNKSSKGYSNKEKSKLIEVSHLSLKYQEEYQQSNQLPMIVYYPINRVAEGIFPGSQKIKEELDDLDVYDNALGGKANFKSFFEWFRLQDDILNEKSLSRTKWMIHKRPWIERKVNKILNIFTESSFENKEEIQYFKSRLQRDDIVYKEPVYLFRELIELLRFFNYEKIDMRETLHDIEYMLFQMSKFSDQQNDDKRELKNFPIHHLERIVDDIFMTIRNNMNIKNEVHYNLINFIWETFQFAILLSFWWISDKGKRIIERHFRTYTPIRSSIVKESKFSSQDFILNLVNLLKEESQRVKRATYNEGKEIHFVTTAIENFIPEYSNLRVKRSPVPHMLVDKRGKTIRLNQLSDGEKNMIAMVGDIARRLSIANPSLNNPLKGNGVVLIDEIDLHLHPSWQREIILKLNEVFPNCQFIVSTHSPQILSHVKAKNIFLLEQEKDNINIKKPNESYGKSTDRQLEDILGVDSRPTKIKKRLKKLYKLIQEMKIDEAKKLMIKLDDEIEGREPELIKANVLIKRKETLGK